MSFFLSYVHKVATFFEEKVVGATQCFPKRDRVLHRRVGVGVGESMQLAMIRSVPGRKNSMDVFSVSSRVEADAPPRHRTEWSCTFSLDIVCVLVRGLI